MIPYNPSSFNSNKTILEQILELKNWLINNPSYQVYSSSESGQTLAYNGYLISALADPTNIGVGDVVVFSNSTLGSVVSVDTDSGVFGCGACISFKGDTGATGSDGNSFKVSTENYVNDSTAYSRANVEPVHSVQVGDVILFANDYVGYITSVSGVNFYVTRTQSVKGDGLEQIKLTSQTGTLTADELVIAEKESTYVFYETPTLNIDLNYLYQNNLNVYYGTIYLLGNNLYVVQMQITKSTGAYTITSNLKPIKATSIDSETATSGQVLMANGSGGASWQTPSTPSIEGTSIKSTGVTSGKVLQADGSGNASWEDVGGGSVELEIAYADIGQALSDSDYAICLNADKMIVNYGSGQLIEYTRDVESSTEIKFARTYNSGVDVILVTKATKVVTNPTYKFIANSIDSQTATSGQVLQADGNGGASWQNAGGGLNRYTQYISSWNGSDWNLARNIILNAKYVSLWITGSFGMTYVLHPTYFSSSTTTFKFVGNGCDNSNNFINYRIDLNTSSRIMTYYTYTIATDGTITYATTQTNVNITFVYLNDNPIT